MESPQRPSLSRASSRSRRSQVNLSNLRISPLANVHPTEPSKPSFTPSSAESTPQDSSFRRTHSSYIHGKSAPASPGILSRSSSRNTLRAGISRRASIYDEVDGEGHVIPGVGSYDYAGIVQTSNGSNRVEVGSGHIPKAKSEAALLVERSKNPGKSMQARRARMMYPAGSRTGGTNTPRMRKGVEDDWLTRTRAATNALLQESKGQSWTAASSTVYPDSTDDDDEGYEELAAQSVSATTRRRDFSDGEMSPVSTRASRWGSRYGSRTASRRTSRRGSVTTLTAGSRTPLATTTSLHPEDGDYFDSIPAGSIAMEPDFVDDENESQDEASLNRLAETHAFGVGGIIDRIMNFNLFRVEEREEVTEDEGVEDAEEETAEQARRRREAEQRRKREEKEKLVQRSGVGGGGEDDSRRDDEAAKGGWVTDAAWLLGVASKAIF